MKPISLALVLLALALAPEAPAQAPQPQRRAAFLVGINHYEKPGFDDLGWSENDVDELAVELHKIGFDPVVVMKGSATGALRPSDPKAILAQLTTLLRPLGKDDLVVVALSGHGQEIPVKIDGKDVAEDFFCPVEAIDGEAESMLSISFLTDEILRTRVGTKLLLLDACRNDTREKRFKEVKYKSGVQGRDRSLPVGTAILFSCREGQQSLERDDLKHSVFTQSVIEALQAGRLRWTSVIDYVEVRVPELNPKQGVITAGHVPLVELGRRLSLLVEGSRPGEERDDNALKMKFCWCPKGSFRMGSPPDEPERSRDEAPVNVTLSRGFWMGKFEVTQDEWRQVMGTSLEEQKQKAGRTSLYGEGPNHPMYFVTHTEAEEFCVKFTESERRAGRLALGWSYRLPTEAQWEYACRAGTTSATAFGNSLSSEQANFDGDSPYNGAVKGPKLLKTTPVGHYARGNAWGLFDMHGNVYEWCRDGYPEQSPGGVDPMGPSGAFARAIRGGGWSSDGENCRSAYRIGYNPENRGYDKGFRVARVPSSPGE